MVLCHAWCQWPCCFSVMLVLCITNSESMTYADTLFLPHTWRACQNLQRCIQMWISSISKSTWEMIAWISRYVPNTDNFRNLVLHVCNINTVPTTALVPLERWRQRGTTLWASAGKGGRSTCFSDWHRDEHHFTDHRAGNLVPTYKATASSLGVMLLLL
jgi:hypothetical protein